MESHQIQQLELPFDGAAPGPGKADSATADGGQRVVPQVQGDLHRRLRRLSRGRIAKLTLTRNRSTILSSRPLKGRGGLPEALHLRIHHCFVEAPDETLEAVVDFASKRLSKHHRRAALAVLRSHFDEHAEETDGSPRRTIPVRTAGEVHDLAKLGAELVENHFGGELDVTVTWGSPVRRRRRRRRTIQLGSYQDETRTVRIHPILDQKQVPRYVVQAVLHHEMLHAVVPAETVGGRRRIHTPEFRRRERQYEHHQRAERWLGRHLFRLMGRLERQLARRR